MSQPPEDFKPVLIITQLKGRDEIPISKMRMRGVSIADLQYKETEASATRSKDVLEKTYQTALSNLLSTEIVETPLDPEQHAIALAAARVVFTDKTPKDDGHD